MCKKASKKSKRYFSITIEQAIWDKGYTKILRKEPVNIRVEAKTRKKAIESIGLCVILNVSRCY